MYSEVSLLRLRFVCGGGLPYHVALLLVGYRRILPINMRKGDLHVAHGRVYMPAHREVHMLPNEGVHVAHREVYMCWEGGAPPSDPSGTI